MTDHLRLIGLEAENVKRLKLVRLSFAQNGTIEIAGQNGNGKSSLTDAIWFALGGGSKIDPVPLRKGETSGYVKLDLGSLLVERRFSEGGGTSLTVKNAEGFTAKSPQAMLDSLFDPIAFDLPSFLRMSAQQQVDLLKRAIKSDVDFDELDQRYKKVFDERRDVNRDAKRERGAAESIVEDAYLPAEPIDLTAITAEGEKAAEINIAISNAQTRIVQINAESNRIEAEIEQMTVRLADLMVERTVLAESSARDPVDVDALRAKFAEAQRTNAEIEKQAMRRGHIRAAGSFDKSSKDMTDQLDAIKRQKQDAIAGAQLPVEGLSWDTDGVTLNGLPFSQAGQAEQLRTIVAVAMALNPRLRVMRLLEAALIDDAGLKILAQLAEEHDFQILLEVVKPSDDTAIVMVDGEVAGAMSEDAA